MAHIRLKTAVPGPASLALMQRRRNSVARGPFHSTPIFAHRANGALIEDVDGNCFIDLAAGIGVLNVGNTHPEVVRRVKEQADLALHTSFNVTATEGYVAVAEELQKVAPGSFEKRTLLVNSGAEAVENAIKIARAFTRRPAIVCFDHAYHGRTYMAMTLTSKSKPYKFGFAPFNSDVYRVPFPYAYRWATSSEPERVAAECFEKMKEVIHSQIGVEQVAAIIIEPVLGEGGFIPAPASFLKSLREFCTDNGVVLIADEVQSGFGRTGCLFASETLGVVPDLLTLAKGLGGGLPIGAVVGRADMMDAPGDGGIGGTFGGNPLACAAAQGVFEVFRDGSLLKDVQRKGALIEARLEGWKSRFSKVGDVRGLGMMRGVELVKDRDARTPDKDSVSEWVRFAYENGVILLSAGTFGNVVRLLPPLVITDSQLHEALDVMEKGLEYLHR